jgi:DNA-binding transcriptional regulator YhcF (GntR family)
MNPSDRIAAQLRHRIRAGELRPGDRLPSTREITREWGVAIATATKVLSALREEGLVRAIPGVGTVVTAAAPARPARPRSTGRRLSLETLVRQGISIADADGLAALSMRRVATELGVATMALYRHVPGKEQLVLAMADTVFGDNPLPDPPPGAGWRARLELIARAQWAVYRRNPWLTHVISLTRPAPMPNGMHHTERALSALDGLGLDGSAMLHAVVTLFGHVRGMAMNLEAEAHAEQDTGMSGPEWMRTQDGELRRILAAGGYPVLSRLVSQPQIGLDLDTLFEFGLARQLDGLALLIGETDHSVGGSRTEHNSASLGRPESR